MTGAPRDDGAARPGGTAGPARAALAALALSAFATGSAEFIAIGLLPELAADLETVYHTVDPRSLLMPLRALVATAEDYLDAAGAGVLREGLLRVVGRGELLADASCSSTCTDPWILGRI